MLKLVKLIATFCLLFTVLTTTAVAIGWSDHTKTPLQAAGFDTCDGKPCYLGITSGCTAWADATKILTLTGTVTNEGNLVEVYAGDSQTVYRIVPKSDSQTIAHLEMYLLNNPAFPPLREIVRLYGLPCGAVYPSQIGKPEVVTLLYPSMSVEVVKDSDALDLELRIANLTLIDPDEVISTGDLCSLQVMNEAPIIPWGGFASWDRYRQRGLFARIRQSP